jgi:hypothetical protein
MGQTIGIDTFVELQQHAVSIAVEGLTSGNTRIGSIISHILQSSSAFGCDDVSRAEPELASGWRLGTDLKGLDFKTLTRFASEMFLDGIIQGTPLGANVIKIAQIGAIWGRDVEQNRRERIRTAEAAIRRTETGLIVGS